MYVIRLNIELKTIEKLELNLIKLSIGYRQWAIDNNNNNDNTRSRRKGNVRETCRLHASFFLNVVGNTFVKLFNFTCMYVGVFEKVNFG